MRRALLLVAVAVVLAGCGGGSMPELRIDNARVWAPVGSATAAYFDITNTGGASDLLLGVEADVADASLHETVMDDDVMKMQSVRELEIPAGGAVRFEPGGLHVMLVDVAPLDVGDIIELRLQFETSGTIRLQVPVTEIETR